MKIIKLTLVCLLMFGFYCCNNRKNKTHSQEAVAESNQIIVSSEDLDNEFTKVYTMKKKDSTLIGDVYVKFENDSLFRYLYIINDGDTLYSIKNKFFLSKNGSVDMDVEFNKIGLYDFWGYMFSVMYNDYFYIDFCNKRNVYEDFPPALIKWNYDNNIIELVFL